MTNTAVTSRLLARVDGDARSGRQRRPPRDTDSGAGSRRGLSLEQPLALVFRPGFEYKRFGVTSLPRILQNPAKVHPMGDDMFTHAFVPPVMFSLGIVFFIIAAGGVLVGWGLMNHERWARMTAIVIGILALFHPPFGTALGIYTLWVLLPADAAAEYDRMSQA